MQPVELPTGEAETSEQDSLIQSIMQPTQLALEKGDGIRVLTLDGKRQILKITAIEKDALLAKGIFSKVQKIPFEEIVFLEKDVKKGMNNWTLFPFLAESMPGDKVQSCEGVEAELIRVDVLRRAINKEIGLLAWETTSSALSLAWHDMPKEQLERNKIARDRANARMIRLLQLCLENSCLGSPTHDAELKYEGVLDRIENLKKDMESGKMEEKVYESELHKFLDSVI